MQQAVRNPALWLAVLIGFVVRLIPVASSDFPLNDGGLFASIIDQLVASGMRPPDYLSYNGADIPFAYPPLAFYLGAALVSLNVPTLDVLHFVPFAVSLLLIPAWYSLALVLFGIRIAGFAAIIYAVVPKSFEWLISGGGLTRGLGLLLAAVALTAAVRYFRTGSRRTLVLSGVLLGLAGSTHPEAAVFGAATACLLAWRERASVRRVVVVGSIAAAVVFPWIARVILVYGPEPLFTAGASRTGLYHLAIAIDLLSLQFTREAYVSVGAMLGAVGLFIAVTSRRIWVVAWIVIAFVLTPAASPTFVMLPFSAAGAIAISEFALPRLTYGRRRVAGAIALAVMIVASVWSPHLADDAFSSISDDSQQAIAWVSRNLPTQADVAIITGVPWGRDAFAEWFPYLARRTSVGTPQGSEFSDAWRARLTMHDFLEACATRTADCLDPARLDEKGARFDYVLIPKGPIPGITTSDCCLALREALRASAEVVYDGRGASVFRLPQH